MALFHPDNIQKSNRHMKLAATYEIISTSIQFSAAILFLIGSIFFFWDDWQTPAIWLFVIGSAFFALSPTVKLIREIHLVRLGEFDELAKRIEP